MSDKEEDRFIVRFGAGNELDNFPRISAGLLNGYTISGAAEYFKSDPFILYSKESIYKSIVCAAESGQISEVIETYEKVSEQHPDWKNIQIDFSVTPILADGNPVPAFIRVKRFSKPYIFNEVGFALYRSCGEYSDIEPQRLLVAHLKKQ